MENEYWYGTKQKMSCPFCKECTYFRLGSYDLKTETSFLPGKKIVRMDLNYVCNQCGFKQPLYESVELPDEDTALNDLRRIIENNRDKESS